MSPRRMSAKRGKLRMRLDLALKPLEAALELAPEDGPTADLPLYYLLHHHSEDALAPRDGFKGRVLPLHVERLPC